MTLLRSMSWYQLLYFEANTCWDIIFVDRGADLSNAIYCTGIDMENRYAREKH